MWCNMLQQSFALQQFSSMYSIFLVLSAVYYAEVFAQQTPQTCVCQPVNTCYQNLPTAGTGTIDIRIVNTGVGPTSAPLGTTLAPPGIVSCPVGNETCCTGVGVVGCGLRWNIPVTPTTTPGPGQARYGSQPWAAVILGIDNTYVGGGVLLDSINVLTVAHKIFNRTAATIKVRLGVWDANRVMEPYPTQEALVIQIRTNPGFNVTNLIGAGDIAILRLATPIQVGPTPNPDINTACLPGATTIFDNMRCLVSGWGRDAFTGPYQSIMKEVEVPILPNSVCQARLSATRLGTSFSFDTAAFICAGGEQGRDACTGDGGSALVCSIGGRYQIAGLVTWGIGCGDANVPGVYVRVQNYLQWIQQNQI